MNKTINYYNQNFRDYIKSTVSVDFSENQDKFLGLLKPGASILDFGCGSGRDTKYFMSKGFAVDAVDGSEELARAAEEYTGIKVRCMLFSELDEIDTYDGIWACSSILHLTKAELSHVFVKMSDALKKNGIIYTSFKYGVFSGERGGRYFTDLNEEGLKSLFETIDRLSIIEMWITSDVRPGREEEKWLNVLIRKN